MEIVPEDELTQSVEDMLVKICDSDSMTPEAVMETGNELFFDVSDSMSIWEERDVITEQTYRSWCLQRIWRHLERKITFRTGCT